jgi:hypothetical protein
MLRFRILIAVTMLGGVAWSCASDSQTRATKAGTELLLHLRYLPASAGAQAYEVRIWTDRTVAFDGIRNVRAQGDHSYQIPQSQYDSLVGLLKSTELKQLSGPSAHLQFADVTIVLDGIKKTGTFGVTNAGEFVAFRRALEVQTGLRAYRCPYELPETTPPSDVCARIDAEESRFLRGRYSRILATTPRVGRLREAELMRKER